MLKNIKDNFLKINTEKILKDGSPWAKFILTSPEDNNYKQIKNELLAHQNIKKLVSSLGSAETGIPSLLKVPADFRVYNSFYWVLRFFADLGLSADELKISSLIHQLQLHQDEDGQFIIRYLNKKQQAIKLVCITAHLGYCLSRLGYKNSATVSAAIKYILTSQRADASFHCEKLKQPGESREKEQGCLSAGIHVIRFLGQFGNKYSHVVQPLISQLLPFLLNTNYFACPYLSGNNLKYHKLRYPSHFTGLDIYNLVDSLSYFPQTAKFQNVTELILNVLQRWDGKNFLCSEKKYPGWAMFDFGHNKKRSDWITALFVLALNRFYKLTF